MPRKEGRYVAQRFATACNRLGIIWAHERRDRERGIAAMERALEYDPDYAGAHKNLGMLYMRAAADAERAVEHFRKYLDLDPRAADADAVRRRVEDLETFIERQGQRSP
jgi:tetratricopeptide (TPR) repeat protein